MPLHEEQRVLPLWDHITELSRRLRIWITAFIAATIFFLLAPADATFLSNPLGLYKPFVAYVLQAIRNHVLPSNVQLIAGSFTAPIMLYFVASAVFGFIVTVPLLAFEVYEFVNPALTKNERKSASPFVLGFSSLFLIGALFGFFILTPLVVWSSLFFFSFTGAASLIRIDDFYNLVFFTTVASGLAFTLPVLLVLLVKLNIVSTRLFTKNRIFLYIAVYILTGFVTPDGNPVSDILLFIPIAVLLETALLVARRYDNQRDQAELNAPEIDFLRCASCNGPIDAGGVFCGRCGRSRL